MDPFTAIGLASSIVQFVDFSTKLINSAREIHNSATGMTEENKSLGSIVNEMKELSSKLLPTIGSLRSEDEKALCRVATECNILSDQILELLEKIKPKSSKSTRNVAWAAVKNKIHEREKLELEKRLGYCRSQLELQLNFLTSSEIKAQLKTMISSSQENDITLENLQSHMDQLRQGVTVASMSPEAHAQLRKLLDISEEAGQIIVQQRIIKSLAFDDMHGRFDAVNTAHFKTFRWVFGNFLESEDDDSSETGGEEPVQGRDSSDFSGSEEERSTAGENNSEFSGSEDEQSSEGENNSEFSGSEDKQSIESEDVSEFSSTGNEESVRDENRPETPGAQHEAALEHGDKSFPHSAEEESPEPAILERDGSGPESFIDWLSSGEGIFHVSGKLGSGKSTLMKFLCEHKRTKAELQNWAGGRTLVFTNFFFWRPGTALQKSFNGLFRSLLHDILNSCPELIPVALPNQWEEAKAMPWQIKMELNISPKEIREAFSRLIQNQNLYEKHCFCFFIDGLDEYEETIQEDYRTMVDLLCSWTVSAPGDVKICVSSREYNVFLNAFSDKRRLRLQDLTRGDMKRYVRDKLKNSSAERLERLVQIIIDKSNGIFLWVALVIKTLRERLEDGHKIDTLEAHIESLPDELESLLNYLLNSGTKLTRKKMYQIFGMMLKLEPFKFQLTLLSYSFIEDYEGDQQFAMRNSFPYSNMSDSVINSRTEIARRMVNGYCRGFLELDGSDSTFGFTHRSIPEFLQLREVRNNMEAFLKGFDPVDALSQLLLAEIRSRSKGIPGKTLSLTVYAILDLRIRNQHDQAPYYFQDCLQSSVLQHVEGEVLRVFPSELRLTGSSSILAGEDLDVVYLDPDYLTSPFEVSAFLGDHEYVIWKIEQDITIIDNDYKMASLLCWMDDMHHGDYLANLKLINFLLRRGLPPQRILLTDLKIQPVKKSPSLSFWQQFIYRIICCNYKEQEFNSRQILGQTIKTFLQYGANPQLSLSFSNELCNKINSKSVGTYVKGGFEIEFGRGEARIADTSCPITPASQFVAKQGGKATFREIVKFWAFDNEEKILQLIDKNLAAQEQATETPDLQEPNENNRGALNSEIKELESPSYHEPQPPATETEEVKKGEKQITPSPTPPPQTTKNPNYWLDPTTWSPMVTFCLGILLAVIILRLL